MHTIKINKIFENITECKLYYISISLLQLVSLLIGLIYFGQELDQDGVMNINGALFIFLTNMTFQNVFAVINVSINNLHEKHSSLKFRT